MIDKVSFIKRQLLKLYSAKSWEDFVDKQQLGDCQEIIASVLSLKISGVVKVFGEIEVDEPYIDPDGNEQIYMTHHWAEIDGVRHDFSKGTLRYYIDWSEEIYETDVSGESRYI